MNYLVNKNKFKIYKNIIKYKLILLLFRIE